MAACTPLPLTGITALDPCVVVTVTLPVTVSDVEGLNVTFIAAFWPGVSVIPLEIPLALTSFALTFTCDIVTFALPLLVIVTLLELELPLFTLPKLTLLGLGDIVTDAANPVPLTLTTFGELGALLAMLTLPLRVPAVVGANSRLNDALDPAPIVVGVVNPLAL